MNQGKTGFVSSDGETITSRTEVCAVDAAVVSRPHRRVVERRDKCVNTFWTSDSVIMCETSPFVDKD